MVAGSHTCSLHTRWSQITVSSRTTIGTTPKRSGDDLPEGDYSPGSLG